uniref:Decapping nuclease n=1 Tax=Petromyzon marinus TaxID=7757 RepID=S4RUU6_PETMA
PVEVGCFSLDAERRFHADARQLRYYAPPKGGATRVEFDLRDGYSDRYVQRDDNVKERLDHVLRWILPNRYKFALAGSWCLHTDVVTWRGHLTKVACTPYERHEGWLMAVTLLAGTRYMSEMETEEARRQRGTRDARQREMTYWGYKFEQYLCAETPGGIPDPGGVVNTNEAFCTVVRTRLKSHSLVFAGEVDCLSWQRPQQQHSSNYVELKTSRELYTPNQRRNLHRFKLIKWWAQSFLVGVPKIVAGFRDDEGVVRRLQTFETLHIPKMVADDQEAWNGSVCLNFVEAFLTFMKKVVTKDDPKTVYLFSWEPGRDVTYSVHPDSELAFLPDWYVSEMTGASGDRPSPSCSPKPRA